MFHLNFFALAVLANLLLATENLSVATAAPENFTTTPAAGSNKDVTSKIDEVGNGNTDDDKNSQNSIDSTDLVRQTGENELDTWEAPYKIRRNFAYYLSGYDEDSRPIWVWEFGRWPLRQVTEGEEIAKIFDKFIDQLIHRMIRSLGDKSTGENPVTDLIVILDMEEFSLVQMAHVPTVSLILRLLAKFREIIDLYLYVALVINTNAPAQGLVTLVRPVLGKIMERAEIYGTNKANWLPKILQHCPRDQLPHWYGGLKDFKPVKVYG